jgi:glyoxylase-like metal-dependent hydrolase (beta-lactamase superfamily II)
MLYTVKNPKPTLIALILAIFISCSTTEPELKIIHQITGPIETNCYLIYDNQTMETALVDVGDKIDTLVQYIEQYDLDIKYILCTHGHYDHVIGVPDILVRFPEAKTVIHKLDYNDLFIAKEWLMANLDEEDIEWLRSDPETEKLLEFDPTTLGEPDIFTEEGQELQLGNFSIKSIHSPGHSPGSVCYLVDGKLFSGDVLFYRTVGRTDILHSSREDQINSVQRLYEILPDSTPVYPGHGQFTDILSEKTENKRIKADTVTW